MARTKRNKSQAIRDYLETDPSAGPAKVIAELKKAGMSVSSPLVSKVKQRFQSPGPSVRRRGRPKKRQIVSRNGRKATADVVDVHALVEARAFANKVGGIDQATNLLQTLARIS